MVPLPEKLLSIKEAADKLGVSTKTLRRWEKRGRVTPQRTIGGQRRYGWGDLERLRLGSRHETHNAPPPPPVRVWERVNAVSPRKLFAATILAGILVGFSIPIIIVATRLVGKYQNAGSLAIVPQSDESYDGTVLASATATPDFTFTVNVPARFAEEVEFQGEITAPNLVYSITAGDGISASDSQNPKITNTGVLSLGGKTGTLKLEASSGISIDGLKITNSDLGTSVNVFKTISVSGQSDVVADGNTDTLTFANGTGVTITTDAGNDKLTFAADATLSGWTDDGTTVRLTTSTDSIGIGTTSPSTKLHVVGSTTLAGAVTLGSATSDALTFTGRIASGNSLVPAVDLSSDLGTASLRFNNIYAANLTLDSGFSSSGQALVTYNPTDTTFAQSSLRINVTTPSDNEQMIGIGSAGEERASIDAEGDLTLGYDGAAGSSVPATSYPLTIYGHNSTNIAFVDTSGNAYFAGNVGIGTTSPGGILGVIGGNGVANDISLVSTTGGIQLSTGSGSRDINILSGDAINLKGVLGAISLSSGSPTHGSGLTVDTSGDVTIGTNTLFADVSSGNVGIGTTSPTQPLMVKPATANSGIAVRESDDGNDAAYLYANDGEGIMEVRTNGATTVRLRGGTDPSYINNGNVGIGTTNPLSKLEVNGVGSFSLGSVSAPGLSFNGDLNTGIWSSAADVLNISTGGSERVRIDTSGNVGIGDTTPDDLLDVESSSLGYNFLFGSGGVTLSTSGTSGLNIDTFGQLSLTSNQGAANALELVSTAGGIDISTGSGTGDIDILGGDAINLKGVLGAISLSSGSPTHGSGLKIDTSGDVTIGTNTLFADVSSGNVGIGTTGPTAKLHIQESASSAYALKLTNRNNLRTWATGVDASAVDDNKFFIEDVTGVVTRLVIDTSGNVGIGDTGPDAFLDIAGTTEQLRLAYENTDTNYTSFTVSSSGDLTLNPTGGQLLLADADTLAVGGVAGQAYTIFSDSGTASTAASDDDVFIEDILEVDGTIDLDGAFDQDGSTFDVSNTGAISLLTTSGTANAIQLVASAGGIDISTGSGTGDIDILGGDAINLKGVLGAISLSSGSPTHGSGLKVDTSGDVTIGTNTLFADVSSGNVGIGTTAPTALGSGGGPRVLNIHDNTGYGSLSLSTNSVANGGLIGTIQMGTLGTAGEQRGSGIFSYLKADSTSVVTADMEFYTNNAGTFNEKLRLSATGGLSLGNSYVGTDPGAGSMIISGNVGIGTTSPAILGDNKTLTISAGTSGDVAASLELQGSRTSNNAFGRITGYHKGNNVADIRFIRDGSDTLGAIAFDTLSGASETMRITSSGNVGIGDTTPDDLLDVESSSLGYNFLFGSNGITLSTSGTSGLNIDTFGQLSLTSNQGAANALELISTAGGIDISTGSGTGDIDILGGDAINLKGVLGAISLSSGSPTHGSGLSINTSGDVTIGTNTLFADVSSGNVGIGTTGPTSMLQLSGVNPRITLSDSGSNTPAVIFQDGGNGTARGAIWGDNSGSYWNFSSLSTNAGGGIRNLGSSGIVISRNDLNLSPVGVLDIDGIRTVASGASAVLKSLNLPASTVTISGSTNITTATGFNASEFGIQTFSNASIAVTNAATVYVAGAPTTTGGMSITNPYALWVDDGVVRFDGNVGIGDTTPDDLLDVESSSLGYNFLFGSNGITLSTSGTSGLNIDTFGQLSLTSNQGAANALELISTAGGIDISTGSGTGDIDILGGDALNLKAVGGAINLSSGSPTTASGLTVATTGKVGIGTTGPTHGLNVTTSLQVGTAYNYTGVAGDLAVGMPTSNSRFFFGQSNDTFGGMTWNYNATPANAYLTISADMSSVSTITNQLTLLRSGNVGIGDTTPDDLLDVESSSLGYNFLFGSGGVTLSTSGTSGLNIDTFGQLSLTTNQGAANALELVSTAGGIDISTGSGTQDIDILSGDQINLKAGTNGITLSSGTITHGSGLKVDSSGDVTIGTNTLFADVSSGNVGIGTTTPSQKLHVYRSTDGPPVRFEDSNGYCEIDPTTTTWTCTSDLRLKKDIAPLDSNLVLAGLDQLRGVNFRWISQDSTSRLRTGFIAQEVETVFPNLVRTDEQGLKSVSYGGFTPYLVEAIKQLGLKIDHLGTAPSKNLEETLAKIDQLPQTHESSDESHETDKPDVNLTVIGQLTAQGALVVEGPTTFKEETVFKKLVRLLAEVIFAGRVQFLHAPVFANNAAGFAVVPQGTSTLGVPFTEAFDTSPVVTISLTVPSATDSAFLTDSTKTAVTEVTQSGFTIVLDAPAVRDTTYAWMAVTVANLQTTVGERSIPAIPALPTPTPTLEPETPTATDSGDISIKNLDKVGQISP